MRSFNLRSAALAVLLTAVTLAVHLPVASGNVGTEVSAGGETVAGLKPGGGKRRRKKKMKGGPGGGGDPGAVEDRPKGSKCADFPAERCAHGNHMAGCRCACDKSAECVGPLCKYGPNRKPTKMCPQLAEVKLSGFNMVKCADCKCEPVAAVQTCTGLSGPLKGLTQLGERPSTAATAAEKAKLKQAIMKERDDRRSKMQALKDALTKMEMKLDRQEKSKSKVVEKVSEVDAAKKRVNAAEEKRR